MSTHPYIPLYVDDYDSHTGHLSLEEDAVYNRLLRLCWRTAGCSLPHDPAWIARKIRLSAEDFARVAQPVLDEFFQLSRGRLVQRRLKREYDTISRKKSARKQAGKKGGEAKALNAKDNQPSIATDLPTDVRASPEPAPNPEPVEEIGGGESAAAPELRVIEGDWPTTDANALAKLLVEQVNSPWLDPNKSLALNTTVGRFVAWRRDGASWEYDVVPTVTAICATRQSPVGSWKFFNDAIARSIADNRRALEIPAVDARHERTRYSQQTTARPDRVGRMLGGALAAVDGSDAELPGRGLAGRRQA